ncbi:MAG: hypothetical protein NTZ68_03090 [Candidatus Dependentiae bacterium]|nr:hypothetical protein [Candidatus Dependentiae bacterium]
MFPKNNYFFIFFALLFPACFAQQNSPSITDAIVNTRGIVTQSTLDLLKLTNVAHDGSLKDIVTQTQASWLRKPGSERWNIETTSMQNQKAIGDLLFQMNLIQEVQPKQKNYQHLLILGGLFSSMVYRLEHAITLWKSGIRYKNIVLLGSARPLVSTQEENTQTFLNFSHQTALQNQLNTEADALKFAYDYINMPEDMRALPVTIIDVPMLCKDDGTLRRPTTGDTIEWWLKALPIPGNCLAISNQPFVAYQHSVLQEFLPATFPFETVGNIAYKENNIEVLLDTVARILYQKLQILNKSQVV